MTPDQLIEQLTSSLPKQLARDLVEHFLTIRQDVVTGTLERSAPGKFVETVVQILQQLETHTFEQQPQVDSHLRQLESRVTTLPDDLKLAVARVVRAMYTLRNKRNIAHKGAIEPNIYDLKYLYASAQWVLSEVVRQVINVDMNTANQLIEFIQRPVDMLVEDFGDKRIVLTTGTSREELLLLLRHYYPQTVPVLQIHKDMDRRSESAVSFAIHTAYEKRLIEGDKQKGYKLTAIGHKAATELARAKSLLQS